MIDQVDTLRRIADALDRIAPAVPDALDWLAHPAYVWQGAATHAVPVLVAPRARPDSGGRCAKGSRCRQCRAPVCRCIGARHAAVGFARHGQIGADPRGPSSPQPPRTRAGSHWSQASPDASLAVLFGVLRGQPRKFLVLIDDLGFDAGDSEGPRKLRSWLEGGVEARPANVRLAVTSNRRAIVERHMREQDDPIKPARRRRRPARARRPLRPQPGLSRLFAGRLPGGSSRVTPRTTRSISTPADALEWSKRRGSRSGRIAWHYVTELAGRAGRAL